MGRVLDRIDFAARLVIGCAFIVIVSTCDLIIDWRIARQRGVRHL